MIHILNHQRDEIVDFYSNKKKLFWGDEHIQNAETNSETFDFITEYVNSDHLKSRNRLLIPDEDGFFREFIINEVVKIDSEIEVYSNGSYLEDLQKAKPLAPFDLEGVTSVAAVTEVLKDTGWQAGEVTYAGIQTIRYDNYRTPLSALKTIANTFELALRFRVDTNGNVIKGRYVDLIPKRGEWTGKEITSGKDLIGVERREKTDELVTALVCLGPEGEDGNRLTLEVKDDEALERWGRGKKHLWNVYEPQSDDEEMTTARLRSLGRTELEKRVNAIVEYETDQASIESVFGLSHEKVRFRDTVRIKDTSYRPPLYIEAQVKEVRRSISDPSQKTFVLGDFIEFEEEDLRALFNSMREHLSQRIALKVGQDQLADYTYDKDMIDLKDIPGVEAKDKLDTDVGDLTIEDTSGSQLKADSAREAAKSYTDANAFLKERQYTNGLYWDENEGLVVGRSDGLVRTVQNATEGIVIQRRTSTSDAWENVIYADHNGDIKFKGSLEGADGIFKGNLVVGSTTIDGNGILTEEGDLKVKDDVTQIVTSTRVLDNMVNDHSFELVPLGNGAWNYATRRVAIDRMQNYFNWMIEGDRAYARVQSTLASDDYQRAKYGYQAAILEQRYYWTQYLRLDIDRKNVGPYTISAYFSAFESTSEPTVCRVLVHAYDFDLNLTQQNSVGNFTVTVYPDEIYKWKRGYATFENLPSNTSYLKIRIDQITGNSTRTLCDGVQMVPLEHPTQYQPEDSLFKYIQGVIGY